MDYLKKVMELLSNVEKLVTPRNVSRHVIQPLKSRVLPHVSVHEASAVERVPVPNSLSTVVLVHQGSEIAVERGAINRTAHVLLTRDEFVSDTGSIISERLAIPLGTNWRSGVNCLDQLWTVGKYCPAV